MDNQYYAKKCICGAVTVYNEEMGESWSMPLKIFREKFPKMRLSKKDIYFNCDYCVNNWGVDLCACGSGNKYNKCNNGYSECGKPMQILGEVKERVIWAW